MNAAARGNEVHLRFIRSLPCVISGKGGCVAHHLLCVPGTRGMAMKAPDCWTLPLSPEMHVQLHNEVPKLKGEEEWFWQNWRISPLVLARTLFALSGDFEAAEWVISTHRGKEAGI